MILINLPGKPIPFKSPAVYQRRCFNPRHAEKEQMQGYIKTQYADELLNCALSVSFTFFIEMPVSFSKKKREAALREEIYPTTRPDTTNYQKFYEDCLTDIVIVDDSLIVDIHSKKRYALKACTVIQINKMNLD